MRNLNLTNLRVRGRSKGKEPLRQGIGGSQVHCGAVKVAHVRRLVLVVLVIAAAHGLGVVRVGLGVGGGENQVLVVARCLLAHRVHRVHPILRVLSCPDVELVIVFLHFGHLCQPCSRQCAVAAVLRTVSSGGARTAQRRQDGAEEIGGLDVRLLHVDVHVVDRVVVGGGRGGVVVVPGTVLPRLVRSS